MFQRYFGSFGQFLKLSKRKYETYISSFIGSLVVFALSETFFFYKSKHVMIGKIW